MANTRKPATKAQTTTSVADELKKVEEQKAPTKREFKADDRIPCRSVTQGALFMEGLRTKQLYEWLSYGDTIDVEYQDLVAAIRSKSQFIYTPYFIIEDEDFIAENTQLDKFYNERYTVKELRDILNLDIHEMKEAIAELPEGAKNSLKSIAADCVKTGLVDSVRKIKALDEIFGTDLNLLADLCQ